MSVVWIYTKRGHLIAHLQEYLNRQVFEVEDYDNKMSTHIYGIPTEIDAETKVSKISVTAGIIL